MRVNPGPLPAALSGAVCTTGQGLGEAGACLAQKQALRWPLHCATPAGAVCTADRARRAAARLAQDEESQGLARRWRSLHRALTSDRGLWSDGDVSQTCHWKLDKSEDPQRRWGVFSSCFF